MAEKRQHERVPMKLKVDWQAQGNFLFEHATNISEHGIFIETPDPQPAGTLLTLQFELPQSPDDDGSDSESQDQRISIEGMVVWVNPPKVSSGTHNPGMGIRFKNLSDIDRMTILSLIKRVAVL